MCLYRANQLKENLHEHNKMKILFWRMNYFFKGRLRLEANSKAVVCGLQNNYTKHPVKRVFYCVPCCCGWVQASLHPVLWASSALHTSSSRSSMKHTGDTACWEVPTSTTGRSCWLHAHKITMADIDKVNVCSVHTHIHINRPRMAHNPHIIMNMCSCAYKQEHNL